MRILEITNLTLEWQEINERVIKLEDIEFLSLQSVVDKTYAILRGMEKSRLVPKEIGELLLEISDFGWWVSELEETPIHRCFEATLDMIFALKQCFYGREYSEEDILSYTGKINIKGENYED